MGNFWPRSGEHPSSGSGSSSELGADQEKERIKRSIAANSQLSLCETDTWNQRAEQSQVSKREDDRRRKRSEKKNKKKMQKKKK